MSATPLSSRLRDATQAMHRIAETSRFMRKMLKGQLPPQAFCILLRNLHALYHALETELDRHSGSAEFSSINLTALYRNTSIARDLDQLHGREWHALPTALSIKEYIDRIRVVSSRQPILLVAHAYVRYMGDLSGGQILAEIINRAFEPVMQSGMSFFRFDGEAENLKAGFRIMLDELQLAPESSEEVVIEANQAFEHHLRLFRELDQSTATGH